MKTEISRKPNPADKLASSGARWLWPASLDDGANQYVEFRQSFQSTSALKTAELAITCDSEYAVWLNGEKVLEFERGSEAFRAAVAKSKFAKHPNWGEQTAGHILLQDHSDRVSFRNIKIKLLDGDGN